MDAAFPGLIGTAELADALTQGPLTILDVRGTGAYLRGHVPGAVGTSWQDFTDPSRPVDGMLLPNPDELATRFQDLGVQTDAPVILVSDPSNSWGAEGRFYWMLHYLGHDRARVLDGGFPKWKAEGRKVAHLPHRARTGDFRATVRPTTLIELDEVADGVMGSGPVDRVLVDARSAEEYRDEGHIPGAVSLPWCDLYGADGTLRPEADLRRMFTAAGITPDREVVPYCAGGVRSAWVFFVLHQLGYPRLRNYDGSWWEWHGDESRPVSR